ncbi:MAG: hypothetical protein IJF88_09015 [Oscillospiraceae bacterium]|nr:hypothetical protein [Oscillospiraceae bacterium]
MFLIHSIDDGRNAPLEQLPAGAITPKVGLALTQTDGLLAVASGTTKPSYICMAQRAAAVASGTVIPVIRVGSDMIFETVFSASASSIKLGNKVTIASDGLRVTATTSSGVAEVVGMDGSASGSTVRVRF